jgi:hypothetical protein
LGGGKTDGRRRVVGRDDSQQENFDMQTNEKKNRRGAVIRRPVRRIAQEPIAGKTLITDMDIVAAATVQADVTREHRAATRRLRELVTDLADELSIFVALIRDLRQNPPAVTEGGDIDISDDRLRKAKLMLSIMGNPIDGAKNLAQAVHRLVVTDRLVYGIEILAGATNDPDQAALAKIKEWDKHIAAEMAKRPYLLAKPTP